MILIDSVAEAPDGVVSIDMHHRGHLSLRTGTVVTVCLMPTPAQTGGLPSMEEIVVSPIAFESWEHLIRITALFMDRPGVVRKLANAMQAMKLNVVYEESATIENSRFHRVEVLAHTRDLIKERNTRARNEHLLESDASLLPGIERRLKAICLNELVAHDGRPRLKVRPMEGLRNAHRLATQYGPSSHCRLPIEPHGRIRIPISFMSAQAKKSPRTILISDTRDRLLRIVLLKEEVGLTFVRVRHRDFIGSLYRISDALANVFTALVTLTRLRKQDVKNDIELLLYSHTYKGQDQEVDRRLAVSQLLSADSLRDLDIEIAYPKKPGDRVPDGAWQRPAAEQLQLVSSEAPLNGEDHLMSLNTPAILANRIAAYDAATLEEQMENRNRRLAAIDLLTAEGVAPSKPQVFLSYRFKVTSQISKIRSKIQSDSLILAIDGQNPVGPDFFRTTIRERIRSCHGFVGVWPPEGPLDWLLWELGVAHAFGIPVAILPHESLDMKPHERLMPEHHFDPYNDRNIQKKFSELWQWFRPKVIQEYQDRLSKRLKGTD